MTVDAKSGMVSPRMDAATAAIRVSPRRIFAPMSSTMTIAASTNRPSATMSPVTDIWWIGTPSALSVATEASVTTGRASATIKAERQPRVRNSTTMTRAIPCAMFIAISRNLSTV